MYLVRNTVTFRVLRKVRIADAVHSQYLDIGKHRNAVAGVYAGSRRANRLRPILGVACAYISWLVLRECALNLDLSRFAERYSISDEVH